MSGAVLQLHRALLTVEDLAPAASAAKPQRLDLSQSGQFTVAVWGGHWDVQPVAQGGVEPDRLRQVLAHARSGGERFQLAMRGTARSLKKQFQARNVPAWQRQGPLLSTPDGALLFVPGLGLNASCWAPAGVPQVGLRWVPDLAAAAGLQTGPQHCPG